MRDHARPLRGAVKAGKALLTRRLNQAADKLRAFYRAPPSQGALHEMSEVKRTIREAVSRVEDAYTKISTIDDPKNFEEYMKKLESEVARADPIIDDITDKIISKELELAQQLNAKPPQPTLSTEVTAAATPPSLPCGQPPTPQPAAQPGSRRRR